MERVCERCAEEDDDLVLVRPVAPGTGADRPTGPELWCFTCRSTVDHATVEDG